MVIILKYKNINDEGNQCSVKEQTLSTIDLNIYRIIKSFSYNGEFCCEA